ncbi:hypothetical protein [Leptolyngbya sp. FACHB-711]|uniref:hypothetical protein n=1 Tax=unclassified Leptolyngbya TaxID=2650499 RepID=UPI001683332A|nr:hypothetical protein [Leptolyngbya sp. FACHB-711]MBD1849202.1 hypothetical protein [Cyanobacteria bacterium FACHB-502]MBD2025140.1 hypothetical protein [Leptolyngbya sp. FACHB-711]
MTHFSAPDSELQLTIQDSLQAIATDLGQPIDEAEAQQLYQDALGLLDHIAWEPITLARLAGTLLVYQSQEIEPEELTWFRSQVKQCQDDEEIEELIESLHRVDSL